MLLNIESRPTSIVEQPDVRKMSEEVGRIEQHESRGTSEDAERVDSARDGVEERLLTREPLSKKDYDMRMGDIPTKLCVTKEPRVVEEEVASPRNDMGFVMENDSKDSQASESISQPTSEGNEKDDRRPSHLKNAMREGRKKTPSRWKRKQRIKTQMHEKRRTSRKRIKRPELRQGHSKPPEKCARGGKRKKQAIRREAWELRKRRRKRTGITGRLQKDYH